MKRILMIVVLLAAVIGAYAQSASLQGVVFEEDGDNRLSNATVTIHGTNLVTQTDENGTFLFQEGVPFGDQVLTISKEGYEERFLPIEVEIGLTTKYERIDLSLTKQEKKKRRRLVKQALKEEKRKEKEQRRLAKKARKAKKKREKLLAKMQRRAEKSGGDVVVVYDPSDSATSSRGEASVKSRPETDESYLINNRDEQLRRKYARMMGVPQDKIRNLEPYEFVDEWMGTPYKMGGHNKDGIDCSAFTQKFLSAIFSYVPERTAQTMFDGGREEEELYSDVSAIRTGDLIFFNDTASEFDDITHVGVYLDHGYFVHSTSNRGSDGKNGVQISELNHPYWRNKRVAWRRMKMRN